MAYVLWTVLFLAITADSRGQYHESQCKDNKNVIVELFEWPYEDVADECEKYLRHIGYCGVQVSPPTEHVKGDQWWTRYQPVSYKLQSRSGDRQSLKSMIKRCNDVGVIIIVDVVINHMTSHSASGEGTGGSSFDGPSETYDGVPYSSKDFHQPYCEINDYSNVNEVRNCSHVTLNDLDGSRDFVRGKIKDFLNDLIGMGVSGFRVDSSMHMWPEDLEAIQALTNDLSSGGRAMFIHEVIDKGNQPIKVQEYYGLGKVTEFRYGIRLAECVRRDNWNCLKDIYDQGLGMADSNHALVFVDNHDTQRGNNDVLSSQLNDWQYKIGAAFLLAFDYGFKRVMCSYVFENNDQGPPKTPPNSWPKPCGVDLWRCEHRWSSISALVKFSNLVAGTSVENWDAGKYYVGFSRGNVAFMAMGELDRDFYTGLPDGEYCDIIHKCEQKIQITGGKGYFRLAQQNDPVVAICVGCNNIFIIP